jgi:predicted ATPase
VYRLELHEFRCFQHAELDLGPMTALTGPNGSGKTSILTALGLLSCEGLDTRQSLFRIGAPDRSTKIGLRNLETGMYQSLQASGPPVGKPLSAAPCDVLQFEPSRLSQPSSHDVDVDISRFGAGFSTRVAGLILSEPERFQEIMKRMNEVIPSFKRVRVLPSRTSVGIDYALVFDMVGGEGIPASAMSEGTLLTLAILTAVQGTRMPPSFILIDELGRGLHPRAVASLIQNLRSLVKDNKDQCIVATTHSPFVVDALEPEEVWATRLDDTGTADVACLASHPDIESLKPMLRTGEIWSLVGEDWTAKQP